METRDNYLDLFFQTQMLVFIPQICIYSKLKLKWFTPKFHLSIKIHDYALFGGNIVPSINRMKSFFGSVKEQCKE